MLFIDFKKAFDSLDWNFMIKSLKTFNFGPDLIRWIETFYKNISSCIIDNGYTSKYFDVGRGVRQADPLSPYLFIICIELFSVTVRGDNKIKGIKLRDEIKLTQFADDLTCSLLDVNFS